jgi:hypothetical protein
MRGVMNRMAAKATFDSQPKTSAFMKPESTVFALSSIGSAPMIGSWSSMLKRSWSGKSSITAHRAPSPVATSSHSIETTRKAEAALSGDFGISGRRTRGGSS